MRTRRRKAPQETMMAITATPRPREEEIVPNQDIGKWLWLSWYLVEQLLLIPEVSSLNPVIGKNLLILNICILSTVYWKMKIKKKRPGMAHLKKILGRELWSSGYRRKLMFWRLWVRIPSPYTFFTLICFKKMLQEKYVYVARVKPPVR